MSYKTPLGLSVIQVSNVDGTAAASTTIGTTEGSGRFVPLYINVQLQSVTGFAITASISIGTNSTDFNNIMPITALTSLDTANEIINLPLVAVISSVAASTAISVKITTPATATTYVVRISIVGWYN